MITKANSFKSDNTNYNEVKANNISSHMMNLEIK